MTLPYELAKELKDKGWPQEGLSGYIGPNGLAGYGAEHHVYSPSLSELIEACWHDSHQFRLDYVRDANRWAACTCWGNFYEDDWQRGETPSIAVARLWLALQGALLKKLRKA
jgi:hypothetical protein